MAGSTTGSPEAPLLSLPPLPWALAESPAGWLAGGLALSLLPSS